MSRHRDQQTCVVSKSRVTALAILIFLMPVVPALGGDITIDWYSVDGGGGMGSTDGRVGGLELDGAIGQHDAGPWSAAMTNGSLELVGGFWAGVAHPCGSPSCLPNDPSCLDCNDDGLRDGCSPCFEQCECDDLDVCTWDQCMDGGCTHTDNVFGDVNHDGLVDIFDILCVLDGFAGVFATCTMLDVELAPCPDGDGLIDIFDILAVLDAFTGVNVCNCPAGP